MTNLFSLFQSAIGPGLTREVGNYLGEPESATKSAFTAAIPAVLAAVATKASTPASADQLLGLLRSPDIDPELAANLPVALGGPTTDTLIQQGMTLASSIFGGRQGAVANALGSMGGLKSSSLSKLLALVVPLVLGLLKKHASDNRLDAGGLSNLLAGQKDFLRGSLDSRLAGALGLPSADAVVSDVSTRAAETARTVKEKAVRTAPPGVGFTERLVFWLAAAAIVLALFSTFRSLSRKAGEPVQTAAQATAEAASSAAEAVKAGLKSLTLPGGLTIEAPEGGFIQSFAAMLADPNAPIDKGLAFDAVNFETGSATLTPDSRTQLEQLGSILTAYPAVTIRVEGYTDSSGDPAANLKLSQDRAAVVEAVLVGEGMAEGRIEARGFGQERPVASNATEEGRAQNRRVEVVVVKR
ncbi:MAG TPA: OmpA family protein [Gemmatimonadota bacterium]|jgi:outer membrane protein OmpA-like peptidoglycan-associated protein